MRTHAFLLIYIISSRLDRIRIEIIAKQSSLSHF